MSKTVRIWRLQGTPPDAPGNVGVWFAPSAEASGALVHELGLLDPWSNPIDVPLTRAGIADALQHEVDRLCANEF